MDDTFAGEYDNDIDFGMHEGAEQEGQYWEDDDHDFNEMLENEEFERTNEYYGDYGDNEGW